MSGTEAVSDCVFCAIVAGSAPAEVVARFPQAIAIVPHHPVVPGHVLVIPKRHVRDAAEDPAVTGMVAECAARLARDSILAAFNLITSTGRSATQTQFHLHWHLVPRDAGDGLALPWTGQKKEGADRG